MAYTHDVRDLTPVMTANAVPENYTISASTETSSFEAYKALDHTTGDTARWKATAAGTGNWKILLPYSYAFNRVDIVAPITDFLGCPRDFYIEGSLDGTTFIPVTFIQGLIWIANEVKTFRFKNDTQYKYCRINVVLTNSTSVLTTMSEVYILREERDE